MRRIILASGSPRRKELVAQMGFAFKVVPSDFQEQLDDSRSAEEVAKELGLGKALDVARKHPDALVIGSDTIVVFEGRQLGKQPSVAAAKKLLRKMSGQRIGVITSVALVCLETKLKEVKVDYGTVVYTIYDDAAIDRYLASNDWQDKAGAVALQGPAAPPVDYMEGDYGAILGISTRLLQEMLTAQGVKCRSARLTPPCPAHPLAQTAVDAL